jgi:hypothetical protein
MRDVLSGCIQVAGGVCVGKESGRRDCLFRIGADEIFYYLRNRGISRPSPSTVVLF